MALHKLARRNYDGEPTVSIKYQNETKLLAVEVYLKYIKHTE